MSIADEFLRYAPKPRELAGKDVWNVFLSYRSVNRAWVLNLYDVLRGLGHKVFLDQCVLKPGDQLTRNLEKALETSQAGVLIWSSATQDSEWVRREYEVLERQSTKKKGFNFVPIRLDQSELPAFAESRIFLDFSAYPDGPNGGELLRLLHGIVGQPLSDEAARFAAEQDEAAKKASNKIKAAIDIGNAKRLRELFEQGGLPWRVSAGLGSAAAEGLTELKCDDEAITMLVAIEEAFPKAIRPKQLRALALARRAKEGDLDEAQEILGELYAAGERDPETLGIYARTFMDRYSLAGDELFLRRSRDLYAEAFENAQDDYYVGINAAAKSVLLGGDDNLQQAAKFAEQVQEIVGTEAKPGDYWTTATVGEVFLIQRKYAEAGDRYDKAVAMAPTKKGNHESTWKQACRLMQKLAPADDERQLVRNAFKHLPDCDEIMTL